MVEVSRTDVSDAPCCLSLYSGYSLVMGEGEQFGNDSCVDDVVDWRVIFSQQKANSYDSPENYIGVFVPYVVPEVIKIVKGVERRR